MKELTEGQKRYRKYRIAYLAYGHKNSMKYHDKYLFGGMRKLTLERDNYTCVMCGITDKEHLKKYKLHITIDHIDGQGCNSKIKNNALDNLQTLCLRCHGVKDIKRRLTLPSKLSKPVIQMTLEGKNIRKFNSMMQAERELGVYNENVSRCCRGLIKFYRGCLWRFA